MASTAVSIFISGGIKIFYQTVLKSQPEDVSGVPYLALAFVQTFNRERQTRREFVLTFVNCSPTILKEYIEDQDLLASGLDPYEVDCVGDEICHRICRLVSRYAGVERMERLQVDVVFETNWDPTILALRRQQYQRIFPLHWEEDEYLPDEEEEENRGRTMSTNPMRRISDWVRRLKYPSDEEEDCRRRMSFVRKFVYGGGSGGSPTAGMGGWEEEVCGICIEAMKVGEMLIPTPCIHHFHASCILPWFKRSCFLPVMPVQDREILTPFTILNPNYYHDPVFARYAGERSTIVSDKCGEIITLRSLF